MIKGYLQFLRFAAIPFGSVALITSVILVLLGAWYKSDDYRTRLKYALSQDFFIVFEQIKRSYTLSNVDVLLIGDSSCLMDVNAPYLSELLQGKSVESLCSMGYAGPEGYARLLRNYYERGKHADKVILMWVGHTFQQKEFMKYWVNFIHNNGVVETPDFDYFWGGLAKFRDVAVSRVLMEPMSGHYGRYFGNEYWFRRSIRENNGTTIDPTEVSSTTIGRHIFDRPGLINSRHAKPRSKVTTATFIALGTPNCSQKAWMPWRRN